MSSFDWETATIELVVRRAKSLVSARAIVSKMPRSNGESLSFLHEYVHFLQFSCSYIGLSILTGLILLLPELMAIKQADRDEAGFWQYRDLALKNFQDIDQQITIHFATKPQRLVRDYAGETRPYYMEPMPLEGFSSDGRCYGFVLPEGRFLPVTVGVLADWCARAIDRRYAAAENIGNRDDLPTCADLQDERLQYRFLAEVLENRMEISAGTEWSDDLVVCLCMLAMMSVEPDRALDVMLTNLDTVDANVGSTVLGSHLCEELVEKGLISSTAFDLVIADARTQCDAGFYDVLNSFRNRASRMLDEPDYFIRNPLNRETVRDMLERFGLPRVRIRLKTGASVNIRRVAMVDCSKSLSEALDLVRSYYNYVRSMERPST